MIVARILTLAMCITMKEVYSFMHEIEDFLANDHKNDINNNNNNSNNNKTLLDNNNSSNNKTLLDSMQNDILYLFSFYCRADRMKKRYNNEWFNDHHTTPEDVQPFYFLHIHKNGGMTVVKELEMLWRDKYWCQSEDYYIPIINDKSIFPYKKPWVITFIRKPLDQVLSSYRMHYDFAIAKGRSSKFMESDNKLMVDVDHCFDDQNCTNHYVEVQSRTLGGSFDPRKFWFVGITEMMYSSLCMLKYKMGVYNNALCDCSNRTSSKISHFDHQSSHAFSPSSISTNTKRVILSHSKLDIQIYDAALHYFVEKLNSTETESGIDFKCGSEVNCATC